MGEGFELERALLGPQVAVPPGGGDVVARFERFAVGATRTGNAGAALVPLVRALCCAPGLGAADLGRLARVAGSVAWALRQRVVDDQAGARLAFAPGGHLLRLLERAADFADGAGLRGVADDLVAAAERLTATEVGPASGMVALLVAKDALAQDHDVGLVVPWSVSETGRSASLDPTTAAPAVLEARRAVAGVVRRDDLRGRLACLAPDTGLREGDFGGAHLSGPSIGPVHAIALLAELSGVAARSETAVTGALEERRASAAASDGGGFFDRLRRWVVRPVGDVERKLEAVRRDAPWVARVCTPTGLHYAAGAFTDCGDASVEGALGPDAGPPPLTVVPVGTLEDVVREAFAPDDLARLPAALGWPPALDLDRLRLALAREVERAAGHDASRFVDGFSLGGRGFARLEVVEDVREREALRRDELPGHDEVDDDEGDSDRVGRGDRERTLGLEELVGRFRGGARWLLIGDGGTGKTTSLRYVAWALARDAAAPAPFLLHAADLAEVTTWDPALGATPGVAPVAVAVAAALGRLARAQAEPLLRVAPEEVAACLVRRAVALLVDGLDEVRDPTARERVRELLGRLPPTAALLVGSREVDLTSIEGLKLKRCRLAPLGQRERDDLLAAWLPDEASRDALRGRLVGRLEAFGRSPLLLALAVKLRDARLDGAPDLFQEVARRLLRDPRRKVDGGSAAGPVCPDDLDADAVLEWLEWLSFTLLDPRPGAATIPEAERGAPSLRLLRSLPGWRQALHDHARAAGLLVPFKDGVAFLHRRFQEAWAGKHLADLPDLRQAVVAAIADPRRTCYLETLWEAPLAFCIERLATQGRTADGRALLGRLLPATDAKEEDDLVRSRLRLTLRLLGPAEAMDLGELADAIVARARPYVEWLPERFGAALLASRRGGRLLADNWETWSPSSREVLTYAAQKHPTYALGLLEHALADPSACRAASWALRNVGEGGLQLVARALGHQDKAVRLVAAAALARHRGSGGLLLIERALGHQDAWVRLAATSALADHTDEGGLRVLGRVLEHGDWNTRRLGAEALATHRGPGGLTLLEQVLRDSDPEVRKAAAGALVGHLDGGGLPLLERALVDPDDGVRSTAARALARARGEHGLRLLERALRDASWLVRMTAVGSLAKQPGMGARRRLADVLEDSNENVRESAAAHIRLFEAEDMRSDRSLRSHDATYMDRDTLGEGGLHFLEHAVEDSDAVVRRAAARALATQHGVGGLQLLERTLTNQDQGVRATAVLALAHAPQPEGLRLLERALEDRDVVVRQFAAEALSGHPGEGALRLLGRALVDQAVDVRQAAAATLAVLPRNGALRLAANALGDTEASVRAQAASSAERQLRNEQRWTLGPVCHRLDLCVGLANVGPLLVGLATGLAGADAAIGLRAVVEANARLLLDEHVLGRLLEGLARATTHPAPSQSTQVRVRKLLGSVFHDPTAARCAAQDAGFPLEDLPAFETAATFWRRVVEEVCKGTEPGSLEPFLDVVEREYAWNADLPGVRIALREQGVISRAAAHELRAACAALGGAPSGPIPERAARPLCLAVAGDQALLLPWHVEAADGPASTGLLDLGPEARRELRVAEAAARAVLGRPLPALRAGVRGRREEVPHGLDGPSVGLTHLVGALMLVSETFCRSDVAFTGRLEPVGAGFRVGRVGHVATKAEAVRLGPWLRRLGVPEACVAEARTGLKRGEERLRQAFAAVGVTDPPALDAVEVVPLRTLDDLLDLAFHPEDRAVFASRGR